jgi:hypothetical protein
MTFVTDENALRKIAKLIRRLSSPSDGAIVATVYALRRVLEADGSDLHTFANHVEKPNGKHTPNGKHIPEEEMQRIFDAGYAAGVQATENRQHGSDDFCGTDGKPTWEAVALFLQRNKGRLDPKHHEFIDKVAARTAWGDEPTERMHKYMHSLFYQLGGKIA